MSSEGTSPQPLSGAVTFLFSDIQGSTRLVKQLREGYGEVLSAHQRLLRNAFASHSGQEVDTQGDSFFVAFPSPRAAIMAAVDAQRSLLVHEWPEGVQLKVRMGVHTGQAQGHEGRYTGLAVHRAARICAAAHGGQVLVSQATQTLLEDEEDDFGATLRDLGEHSLKDFDRPVRLYQLETDDLPTTFPPLTSALEPQGQSEPPRKKARGRRAVILAVATLAVVGAVTAGLVFTRGSGNSGGVGPNRVGVVDPETNQVVAEIPVGMSPGPLAVGAGSLWVGNLGDRTLTRIDVKRRHRSATISLGDRTPTGVAFGAGAAWAAHGLRGQVSRVSPRANSLTTTIPVADPGSGKGAVTVGDGSVWVVYGDSTLARIDPRTRRVAEATFAGASPSSLVVAAGLVWVVNSGESTVTRYDPRALDDGPVGAPIRVGQRPTAIAYGEGALWVTDAGDDTVTRINPSTNATSTIAVGDGPTAIAAGGGLVWVANTRAGTITRIDPVSERVAGTVRIGNAPAGIAVAGDAVWVTVQARHE